MKNSKISDIHLVTRPLQIPLTFIALGVFVYFLVVAKSLLLPLVMAVGFWYLINALAKRYAKIKLGVFKIPNFICYIMAITTLGLGISFVIDLVSRNISEVVQAAPTYQQNFELLFNKIVIALKLENQPSIKEITGYFDISNLLTSFAKIFTGIAGKTLIVFVYVAFLLYEQRTFDEKISYMTSSREKEKRLRAIIRSIDEKIQKYIWVKTIMSALTGGFSFIIMKWVGVDFAEFWGLVIFFLNFIPTIGSLLGIIFPAVLTLVQFDSIYPFVIVSIGLSIVQMGIGNFLDPRMMGESLNLSPLVILLSLATWGTIWGIPGMFLSIPIMVIVTITLSQFETTRPIAVLLSRKGQISPIEE